MSFRSLTSIKEWKNNNGRANLEDGYEHLFKIQMALSVNNSRVDGKQKKNPKEEK